MVLGMMAKEKHPSPLFLPLIFLLYVPVTYQLESSQTMTLAKIKQILGFPSAMSSGGRFTDFCNIEPNSSVTVICYEESVTQLHIIGEEGFPMLPRNFSIGSLFDALVRLPSLKVLTLASLGLWGRMPAEVGRLSSMEILNVSSNFLYGSVPEEISALKNLQTLILDDNKFTGPFPDWLTALPVLAVVGLRSNCLGGSLPYSLGALGNLRVLSLSRNRLSGNVPGLSNLTNLQVLDLEDNYLGPQFPSLGRSIASLVLRNNRFRSSIPAQVSSCSQLQRLDISLNRFVGPFPPSLLSLPSINYIDISGNEFTGKLFRNTSCSEGLKFVDFSSNLLTGGLPSCLRSDSKIRVIRYANNCLTEGALNQHPQWFCKNEALAVGLPISHQKKVTTNRMTLPSSTAGGVCGGAILIGIFIWLILRRVSENRANRKKPRLRLITENVSTGIPSKLLSDARYIYQKKRLGGLSLPAYRTFSLGELEEATNNFENSSLMAEGSHGQMYRGKLNDGSLVAIRCLRTRKRHYNQNFVHHIELFSKLRHRHLVSALGHCLDFCLNNPSESRLFLVFEFVLNGTLRSNISGEFAGPSLSWTQRIAVAMGVARGIQFLHTGIIPGVFKNNLKTANILLDQNLAAKISCYHLLLAENMLTEEGLAASWSGSKEITVPARMKHEEKKDVYDFGVILMEIITGRPIASESDVEMLKFQLQESMSADESARRSLSDPAIHRACVDESLKTVMEICVSCLADELAERPSVEDVLWKLHFAAQVQDAWRQDSLSSNCSPVSLP